MVNNQFLIIIFYGFQSYLIMVKNIIYLNWCLLVFFFLTYNVFNKSFVNVNALSDNVIQLKPVSIAYRHICQTKSPSRFPSHHSTTQLSTSLMRSTSFFVRKAFDATPPPSSICYYAKIYRHFVCVQHVITLSERHVIG